MFKKVFSLKELREKIVELKFELESLGVKDCSKEEELENYIKQYNELKQVGAL